MAKSAYEYVKYFESSNVCLYNTYIIVRLDGRSFSKFTQEHNYDKPNDLRGVELMNVCAMAVMKDFGDIMIAYGQSDEYSFIFHRTASIFNRRSDKILSVITSIFSSHFVYSWNKYFQGKELMYPPCFDGRVLCVPTQKNVRDYLSWRQVDCHINNLYNTCYWSLVHDGETPQKANSILGPTDSGSKNELLFSRFGINYNNVKEVYRKGSVIIREKRVEKIVKIRKDTGEPAESHKSRSVLSLLHCDIIGDAFWVSHPTLLGSEKV